MNARVASLALLAAAGCGWPSYTFVATDTGSPNDATDIGFDAVDAIDAMDVVDRGDAADAFDANDAADAVDASDAMDIAPDVNLNLFHFGIVNVEISVQGSTARISSSAANFYEVPMDAGVSVTDTPTSGCNISVRTIGPYSGLPPASNVGALSLTNGAALTQNFMWNGNHYDVISQQPSFWPEMTMMTLSATGGGDWPPFSFNFTLGAAPQLTSAPMQPPDGGMAVVSKSAGLNFAWAASSTRVVVRVLQSSTTAFTGAVCSFPNGSTGGGVTSSVLGEFANGPIQIQVGGGTDEFRLMNPAPGHLSIVALSLAYDAVVTLTN